MSRRIPPLNPLRVFEVVARTENLTNAAKQLHVTQSAVSRQIVVLEEYLGVQLLKRERHGVALTQAGQAYAAKILPAFEAIAEATQGLTEPARKRQLRVGTYNTLAAKWLIPRLPDFQRRHPDIEVSILNSIPEVDFDRDPLDAAIQFGDGSWPEVQSDLLFHDEIEPVCSPAFLARHAPNPRYPQSLLRQSLLVSRYRRTDWEEWLRFAELEDVATEGSRMTLSSNLLCWQAALDGVGIAVGQTALLRHELEEGRLVRPFDRPLARREAYYFLRPRLQRESHTMESFRGWLLAAAQTEPTAA
ncbi:MAG: transcriptional regulator GcvA [Pseudorhodoferax sp.]